MNKKVLTDHVTAYLKRTLTLTTQSSQVLIWQSEMILPSDELSSMLFPLSLDILFPCKSSHVRENRFAPALGQNFMGYRVWTCSVQSTYWMLIQSFPFFINGLLPELPCIDSWILITLNRLVLSLAIWQEAPELPIQIFLMKE